MATAKPLLIRPLFLLARRLRRVGFVCGRLAFPALRLSTAGAFLFVTLATPFSQARAQSRASFSSRQYDEFSTSREDGDYFSPDRLRQRLHTLDTMVEGLNNRFARLQGRSLDRGASENLTPQVFQAALERFQAAAQFSSEIEMKRAQFSQTLASAGGFQFRSYPDGRRMWFKNGRVHRIENEKITDGQGRVGHQDVVDMAYDKRGNLLSSKTILRDADGHLTTKNWVGTYADGPNGKSVLASFAETTWDPLGNETKIERTGLTYGDGGKNAISYQETTTDKYGQTARRTVTGSSYDGDGNLLSFHEESEENGVALSKDWSGAVYQKYQRDGKDAWRLTSYSETTTDAQGRQSRREWGGATYDENNSLKTYTQKDTDSSGESRVLTWGGARYDARGNVTEFTETRTGPEGESRRTWRGGQYDAHSRLTDFEELNVDAQGVSTSRRWSGAEYNAKGDLLRYRETDVDGHGLESVRTWTAGSYNDGRLTAYSETTVDDRGHAALRQWNGLYGADRRLGSFSEESTDALGNVTRRGQEGLTYDSLGRAQAYDEWSEDAFGQRTASRWTAAGYDLKDRLTGYQLIETLPSGRTMTTARSAMTYDSAGRLAQYDDALTAQGGNSPDATGRQTVRVLSFDAFGQATLTQTTSTNALGEATERTHQAEYDGRGRLASTADTLRSADGAPDVARWSVDAFDEYDRATATREITGAGESEKTKVWSGRFDSKGLATESTETTTDARGLSITTRLSDAVHNAQGRLTDSLQVTQRSDMPGVTIETRTTERTYDRAGAVTGGREVTRTTGEWNGQPLDVTTVRRTEEAVLADGFVTGYRQTVLTTGVSDGRSLHTQDETRVALGAKGDRTETTHRLAFGKDEILETDAYSTLRRTNLLADLAGRALSYTEERSEDFSPLAKTTTRRENRYSAAGVLTGFTEDSVDGLGLRSHSETIGLVENAAGQQIASRERITHPGQTVVVDEIAKSEIVYSPLGQLASYREQTLSTGPGLSNAADARKTLSYDGAGRVAVSSETGTRNGAAYTTNTFNAAFDLKGRPVHSVEESTGPGGPSDIERSAVAFDDFGRRVSYHEEGVAGGSMVHQTVATEYDALGREAATETTGFRESGAFRERSETTGINDLGQSTGRRVTGHSAAEGDYAYSQTGQVYGLAGDLISFDKERTDVDGITRSHWASKGADARGRSLGYTETGSVAKDGQPLYEFTTEQTAGAYTLQNQAASYDAVTTKRFSNGPVETAATHWTDGAYDAQGRLTGFKETQTTTLTDNGQTKTSTTSRLRESATYYDDNGPGHLKGQLASTVEVLLDDLSPEKARRVRTAGMTYDAEGRLIGAESTTGEVNRLKDALRRLGDLLGGGAKAGGNILTGLRQLLENTADLTSDVVAWAKDNLVSPTQVFLEGLGAWLADVAGGKGAANPALDREAVSELVYRIHEKAGGANLEEIPAGFQSAAAALGTFDQTLTVTRAVDKVFDPQGRATAWREIALSASAPDRPAVTDVRVTYKDNSRLLSTYAARTVEGEKVTQLFRDHYAYDALNRGLYREATFEGEDLAVLSVEKGNVSTTGAQWGSLKGEARSLLLSDILEGSTEIIGKVDFKRIDDATFDAAGNMLDIFGTRTTRGIVLSDFAQGQAIPSDYGAMVESALKAAQAEYDQSLAALAEIADAAEAQASLQKNAVARDQGAVQDADDLLKAAIAAKEDALARLAQAGKRKSELEAAVAQFVSDRKEIDRQSITPRTPIAPIVSPEYVKDGKTYVDVTTTQWYQVLKFDDAGNLVKTFVQRLTTDRNLVGGHGGGPVDRTVTESEADPGSLFGFSSGNRGTEILLKADDGHGAWADKLPQGDAPSFQIDGKRLFSLSPSAVAALTRLADLHRSLAATVAETDQSTTNFNAAVIAVNTAAADLQTANAALAVSQSALDAAQSAAQSAQSELQNIKVQGLSGLENKKIAIAGEFAANAAALAKTLSGLDLLLNGSLRLTEADALALVTRGTFDHAGQSLSLAALASAKVKTSLNNEEHFAQLSVANPQKSVSLSWQGELMLNGAPLAKSALSAALTPNALAAPPAADGSVAGLSVAEGGRLTINRTLAQTQDAAGRITGQNTETLTLSRTDGKTTARRTLQDTAGQQYDARGQLIGYVRTTREDGKDPVVETLTGAEYDDSGRQTSSDVRVTESSPNGLLSRNVHTDVLSINAAGQAVRSRRVVDSGGQITVTQDMADTLFDGEGRAVFALSESVGSSRESWERAGGNFAALTGERTRSAGWTTAFDDRGQALSTLRVSTPNFGGTAQHFVIETNRNTYDDAGRLSLSTTDSTEFGYDPKTRSSLYKSGREERRALAFTAGGQALRERITRTENGLTSVTEDEADRFFDAQGRVVQTQTVSTDAQGLKSHSLWKALAFDADGRSLRFERTTTDAAGLKTVERSAEDAAYDDRGRLTSQSLDLTEWNDQGTQSRSYRKTEDQFDYDGFGRVLSLRQTTDKTDANGAALRDTKTLAYRYDQQGRAVNTWTDGIETAGGQTRDYHYGTAVLAFDAQGRNARTRTTTIQDGLRTDRFSTSDISYDAQGRVIKSRDLVHQWGTGLDAYTSEETTNSLFDDWGRAVDSLSIVTNGALKTVSHSHDLAFDANGRLTRQTIDVHESSTLPGIELTADRTITQTDMNYDAIGNLVDYTKVVKEGELEATSRPALLEYDKNGRAVVSLERVTDNLGRDEIVGNVGSQYNALGQLIGGQSITVKGNPEALNTKQLSGLVAAILDGDMQTAKGQALVKSLGLEGLSANRTVSPNRYDAQGRLVYTDTVMDKAGWALADVAKTEVLFDQTISRGDAWWYDAQLNERSKALEAQGFKITDKTFRTEGNTSDHRYCYAALTYTRQVKTYKDTHERSTTAVTAFDALNRPIAQTIATLRGANATVNHQTTAYDAQGRAAAVDSRFEETGINGDGSALNRRFNQQQSFTYDAAGRSTAERTRTWADSAAPLKDTTSTVDQIVYEKGQRVAWSETTASTERTQQNVRRRDSVQYDGLGRIAAYNADTYEGEPGALRLQYSDRNARNTYDGLSRLVLTLGQRNWGRSSNPLPSAASPGLSPSPLMGEGRDGGETGVPGGGIQGLSEGWTSGAVAMAIAYEYANGSSSISGQWVTAHGAGFNAEDSVRAAGIDLNHHEYGMRYDSVGRVTAYKAASTQIEKYDYYKQGQKGLKRSVKKGAATGAVTTESDVIVTEFDGFGRTVRSVTESQRNDLNHTWTRTETLVKSFDTNGRALDVERRTDSKMTVAKSRAGLGGAITKALGKAGSWMLAAIMPLMAPVIASGSLGGQKMYSSSVVSQRLAYRLDGAVDESRTTTDTLSQSNYLQGKNMGDTMMMDVAPRSEPL
ncbi:MAG: RHS repeat protein [Elusimicrobia bacterium]|nr:RHS repeat protein [Elusimicrobiota bacterium]